MARPGFLLIIFCNVIWALNSPIGKVLVLREGGLAVAWLRYMSAFLAFVFFAAFRVVTAKKAWSDYFLVPPSRGTAAELAVLGAGTFALSPLFQFIGLENAQAMDSSILVATEPLLTLLLARVVLGEKMTRAHRIALGLAAIGFMGLSGWFSETSPQVGFALSFLLLAQLGEAAYSVFGKKLALRFSPTPILGSALLIGAVLLSCGVGYREGFPRIMDFSAREVLAVLWIGPLGSTATYLIWTKISRKTPIATLAISLFIQPIVGTLVGLFFLGESLSVSRWIGAGIILSAVAFLTVVEARKSAYNAP